MKLLEWNIHKMTNKVPVKPFVYKRILEQCADIICLVEYFDDTKIKDKLSENYWISESTACSGNQILIAISKEIAPKGIEIKRATEEALCYNFLHISYINSHDEKFSVIGVRMLSPMDASKQTKPLNKYLSKLQESKESFVCMGDFNIKRCRMKYWFPEYNIGQLKCNTQKIDNSSIVYVEKYTKRINGFGAVDHVLGSDDLQITAEYKWDFIEDDDHYPKKCDIQICNRWEIDVAYPDHAMMIAEIDFLKK